MGLSQNKETEKKLSQVSAMIVILKNALNEMGYGSMQKSKKKKNAKNNWFHSNYYNQTESECESERNGYNELYEMEMFALQQRAKRLKDEESVIGHCFYVAP